MKVQIYTYTDLAVLSGQVYIGLQPKAVTSN